MPNELQGLAQLEEMSIACVSQCFLFIQNQVGKNLKHKKAIVLTFLKIHYWAASNSCASQRQGKYL